jgi:two-component system CheB/CheR fusion protein
MVVSQACRERTIASADDPHGYPHTLPRFPTDAAHAGDMPAIKEWLWAFAQQSLDYAILLIGTDERVRWANPGAAWILAATSSELVGSMLAGYFTPEDRALGIPRHETMVAQRQTASLDDRWMLRADGSRFWAVGHTIALSDREGLPLGFLKIFRDMTELKMRINRLDHQTQALGADNAARAQAIATIAHELRAPLSSVTLAAAALRQGRTPAHGPTPLDIIERNAAMAAQLVCDLEQALQADNGRIELAMAPLRLDVELHAALEGVLQRMPAEHRQIDLLLPPGVPITVEGDPLRLQQVFANLIANAIKFTPPDGRVSITGTLESRQVVVRVEDNGIGIDPAMLETIFGMFTQVSAPARGGFGIGLALVKNIVELHGGTVQAHSNGTGKGSTFIVRLPQRHPPVVPAQAGA